MPTIESQHFVRTKVECACVCVCVLTVGAAGVLWVSLFDLR